MVQGVGPMGSSQNAGPGSCVELHFWVKFTSVGNLSLRSRDTAVHGESGRSEEGVRCPSIKVIMNWLMSYANPCMHIIHAVVMFVQHGRTLREPAMAGRGLQHR